MGNAQDQLGYYDEEWAYPQGFYYSVDHYLYNVGPTLAQQNIQTEVANGFALGFGVGESAASLTAALGNDHARYLLKRGIEVWGYPRGAPRCRARASREPKSRPVHRSWRSKDAA